MRAFVLALVLLMPASVSAQVITQHLKLIPATFTDDRVQHQTASDIHAQFDFLKPMAEKETYGKWTVDVQVTKYVDLPIARTCGNDLGGMLYLDGYARNAAEAAGISTSTPGEIVVYLYPALYGPFPGGQDGCHDARTRFSEADTRFWWNFLSFNVFWGCKDASGNWVALPDTGRSCFVVDRNWIDHTGQGDGAITAGERNQISVLPQSSIIVVNEPAHGSNQTVVLGAVEDGTGRYLWAQIPAMGIDCEKHHAPEWPDDGMVCAPHGVTSRLLDLEPDGSFFNGGSPNLKYRKSMVLPSNNMRLTVLSVSPASVTFYVDHADETLPPLPCTPDAPNTRRNGVGAMIVDPSCNVWLLNPPPQGFSNPYLTLNGATTSGLYWASAICLAVDSNIYALDESGKQWYGYFHQSWIGVATEPANRPTGCGLSGQADTLPPTLVSLNAATSSTVSFNFSDNVAVAKVEVWLGTTLIGTVQSGSGSVNVPLPVGSLSTVTVKAFDAAGNVTTSTVTVK